jgi:hypothetical protein
MGEAAKRLNVTPGNLNAIIHGRRPISPQAIDGKRWREILAAHYPNTWSRNRDAFERRVMSQADNHHQSISADWKAAAGDFVRRVLAGRGDDIDDIVPDISVPALKKRETWQRIVTGDQALASQIFKDALKEVCRLYNLEATTPADGLYAEAQSLIARLGR